MRIAGHSSVTVSQRLGYPSPESFEKAFERVDMLNRSKGRESARVPAISSTPGKTAIRENIVKSSSSHKMGA
jgi:hypothetical protein